jgi:3-methyladenine DNA glycosylase AlkC
MSASDFDSPTPAETPAPAPALKDWFDAARFRQVGRELKDIHPEFDTKAYLRHALRDLDNLTLMQRLRRMTEGLHEGLPAKYEASLEILRELAPRIDHSFVTLVLPDYVGVYGQEHFRASMAALKEFTVYGSSEFAIREFLRRDLTRTLKVMELWSHDEHEAVRRLASEGSRPRLPWSFRLEALVKDPAPVRPILENLRADPSLYVRKSVANHLNDITKDHPEWTMDLLEGWPLDQKHPAWIAKRALRTLIKKGDARALTLVGAGETPQVRADGFTLSPARLILGQHLTLTVALASTSARPQRLIVDYVIHYVKKSGGASEKVFKWKELDLGPGEAVTLTRRQQIKDFTTRVHHPGKHLVEVAVNGERLARGGFDLAKRA